ncbi:MAG TPA: hypothetical protein VLC92_06280 [Rhodocyclaceae bacterium]|nr:hypothetical protein [Rhodocyclaceae bacterium]
MYKHTASALALAISLIGASSARAEDGQFPWLNFSGYGTLGVVKTDDPHVGFQYPNQATSRGNTWNSDVDTRIATQFDINRGGPVSGVLQLMAIQREDGSFKAAVEWANVMWTVNDNWRVRAGRMVTPVFLQSDYRFVGYSLIPGRYSPEMAGNYPLSNHDGAEVIYGTDLGSGHLQLQGYGGTTKFQTASLDLKATYLFGGAATYTTGPYTFRASATSADLKAVGATATDARNLASLLNSAPVASTCTGCATSAQYFQNATESVKGQFYGLAFAYDEGPWYGQAEYGYRNVDDGILPRTSGWLMLGAYRYNRFTPFVSYSGFRTHSANEATLSGTGYGAIGAAAVNNLYLSNASNRDVFGVGVRWDFYRNVALKLQAETVKHEHKDAPFTGSYVNLDPQSYDGRTNLYTATIDFVF